MRANEFIIEKEIADPTRSQCQTKRLSNVRYSQCVSLGYKAHDTDHTDGTGRQGKKGSGVSLRGKSGTAGRSEIHGGRVKDYDSKK
jgi:hypothetical protein